MTVKKEGSAAPKTTGKKTTTTTKSVAKAPDSQALAPLELTPEKLRDWLKQTGKVQNLNDDEIALFVDIARSSNLNPFKREIHVTKYSATSELSIVVGYEVYTKRAEATGLLDGWKCELSGNLKENSLKAILTIYRKDWKYPFVWEAYYKENVGKKKDGTVNKFWNQRPGFMLKKVCISQGFRLCFTDALGGLPYTQDELNTGADAYEVSDGVVVDTETAEVKGTVNDKLKNDEEKMTAGEEHEEAQVVEEKIPLATKDQKEQIIKLVEHSVFDGKNSKGEETRKAILKGLETLTKEAAIKWIKQMGEKIETAETDPEQPPF